MEGTQSSDSTTMTQIDPLTIFTQETPNPMEGQEYTETSETITLTPPTHPAVHKLAFKRPKTQHRVNLT